MRRGAALAAAALCAACGGPGPSRVDLEGVTMGTTYRVTVLEAPAGLGRGEVRALVEPSLARVDAALSTWRDDSELARFNAGDGTGWFAIGPDTELVIREALRASRETGGAFDPTVGPLVELWGFGRDGPRRAPGPDAVRSTLDRVGASRLELRSSPPGVRRTRPGIRLDLSGIGKGFAVDAVSDRLAAAGLPRHLVEIGGELRARGRGPGGRPWRVAVEHPARDAALRIVRLEDRALATSGSYRNFRERDGVRHSHIIDPRTGRPVDHALVSASVIDRSALRADALATALMVLGPDAGLELARRERWAVLLAVGAGDDPVEIRTAELDRHVIR